MSLSRSKKYRARIKARMKLGEVILCGICEKPILKDPPSVKLMFTVDHILPRALGGRSRMDNMQPAHQICNVMKGKKYEADQLATLKQKMAKRIEAQNNPWTKKDWAEQAKEVVEAAEAGVTREAESSTRAQGI